MASQNGVQINNIRERRNHSIAGYTNNIGQKNEEDNN